MYLFNFAIEITGLVLGVRLCFVTSFLDFCRLDLNVLFDRDLNIDRLDVILCWYIIVFPLIKDSFVTEAVQSNMKNIQGLRLQRMLPSRTRG